MIDSSGFEALEIMKFLLLIFIVNLLYASPENHLSLQKLLNFDRNYILYGIKKMFIKELEGRIHRNIAHISWNNLIKYRIDGWPQDVTDPNDLSDYDLVSIASKFKIFDVEMVKLQLSNDIQKHIKSKLESKLDFKITSASRHHLAKYHINGWPDNIPFTNPDNLSLDDLLKLHSNLKSVDFITGPFFDWHKCTFFRNLNLSCLVLLFKIRFNRE